MSRPEVTDLNAPLISASLDHPEHDRGNSPRTRNARLALGQPQSGKAVRRP